MAAQILKGRKVDERVRCIVIPGTQQVVKDCLAEGLVDIFVDAGAIFTMPTCGPCLGGFCGVLAVRGTRDFHDKPQFCRPHGPHGQRDYSGRAGRCGGFRRDGPRCHA